MEVLFSTSHTGSICPLKKGRRSSAIYGHNVLAAAALFSTKVHHTHRNGNFYYDIQQLNPNSLKSGEPERRIVKSNVTWPPPGYLSWRVIAYIKIKGERV